jgi:putative transposase
MVEAPRQAGLSDVSPWSASPTTNDSYADVGIRCTRRRTCSTRCQSACSRGPRACCARWPRRPRARTPRRALERFRSEFDAKYPKALAKLEKDWKALTAFFDFPAEHWRHLRTTNPIESSFATVKLRKGAGSGKAALAMAYKLLDAAQERWRRLNGHELVTDVLDGVKFKDGIKASDEDTTTTDDEVAA